MLAGEADDGARDLGGEGLDPVHPELDLGARLMVVEDGECLDADLGEGDAGLLAEEGLDLAA